MAIIPVMTGIVAIQGGMDAAVTNL